MKREVDSVREEDRNNANFRIKKDQVCVNAYLYSPVPILLQMDQLYRLLREAMMEYNQVHNDYRNKMKQRIEKEIHHSQSHTHTLTQWSVGVYSTVCISLVSSLCSAGKTVSDEQIETLLEAPNLNTFTQDVSHQYSL